MNPRLRQDGKKQFPQLDPPHGKPLTRPIAPRRLALL